MAVWTWARELAGRLKVLVTRDRFDREVDEELRLHVELKTAEYADAGLPAGEARRRAGASVGGALRWREESRDAWGWTWLETFGQDLRYGARTLRRLPGFTFAALLTLALGIGATTAIFSVLYGVLLSPLPYAEPSRLAVLNETTPKVGSVSVSYPNFLDWRAQSHTFGQMAAVYSATFNLAGIGQPQNVNGEAVSSNLLSLMGVHPIAGRDFESSEDAPGTPPVVLVSSALWQSQLGGDPNAVGRTLTLDGVRARIIGVLPPDFRSLDKTDVLEPVGVLATGNDAMTQRGDRGDMVVLGRLAKGATLEQARAELSGIAARLAMAYPATNDQFGVELESIRDTFVGTSRPAILLLFGAVICVLLIACANVANLFLVRGAARTREIALRLTCGATRGRIVRQMLTESVLLASAGGGLGLALAVGGLKALAAFLPAASMSGMDAHVTGAVLAFAAAVVLLAAFGFGLAPALYATRTDVQSELKAASRTTSASASQHRVRGLLAVAEIALALTLLVGAGLMMKSLYRLVSVDPGFRPAGVTTAELDLTTPAYAANPAVVQFWLTLLGRVRALPGVGSAALGTNLPMTGNHGRSDVTFEGMPVPRAGSWPHPDVHKVTAGYFQTLSVPLTRGRDFTDADASDAPRVAVISTLAATQFFPNEDPVGKRFMFGHPAAGKTPSWITIVGVAGPTKLYGLSNPARLEVYLSARQSPSNDMTLAATSALDPAALAAEIREAVASIDPDQPVFNVSTMDDLMKASVSTERVVLVLLGLFSGLALVLATIGIYGVIAFAAARRTHEVGIRMALGAQRGDVLRMILGQGAVLAGVGIGVGAGVALGVTRLMAGLLYSVSAADPTTFLGVAVLLAAVALAACYLPAHRAVRTSPTTALRSE